MKTIYVNYEIPSKKKKSTHNWSPEGKEREKGAECLFKETVTENFPNLRIRLDVQVQ